MDKLDRIISETLDDEEREILEKIGLEQSFPEQVVGLFRGRFGLYNTALLAGHIVFAVLGIYAAWKFFNIIELFEAVRWGLSAAVLLLASLMLRVTLLGSLQANRVLHTVKHLEMQISLLAAKR